MVIIRAGTVLEQEKSEFCADEKKRLVEKSTSGWKIHVCMHNSAGWPRRGQNKHSRCLRGPAASVARGILWFWKGITSEWAPCTLKREFEMTPASSNGAVERYSKSTENTHLIYIYVREERGRAKKTSLYIQNVRRRLLLVVRRKKHARHTSKHSETEAKCARRCCIHLL